MVNREKRTISAGSLVINLLCAVGVILLLLLTVVSFGWFTGVSPVNGRGASLSASNGVFELASADKSGKYDALLIAPAGDTLSGIVFEDGTPADLVSTSDGKPEVKWLMNDESNFDNPSGEGIQPGSYGKMTFYVVAKQDQDLDLTFSLDMILYDSGAEPISELNPDNSTHIIPDTETAAKLINGHILFFEHYDEASGVYSDRITDSFRFTQPGAVENTAYKVEFYWIWPEFIDQLILPSDDALLRARGYDRITADGQQLITDADSEDYFTESIAGLSEMLENMSKGSEDEDFDIGSYNLLNSKWNEADQMIGTNVGYIELLLTADVRPLSGP